MPSECPKLGAMPVPIPWCRCCGQTPFVPFMRGQVQRGKRRWLGLGPKRAYCAIICAHCKEMVGYEDPDGRLDVYASRLLGKRWGR